jgi:hypothetical protein
VADPSYLDFAPNADDNVAPPPKGAPEGGFKGAWANDCIRWLQAVVRRLGDRTLFAPLKTDGTALGQQAGSLALQKADDVNITGGVVDTPRTRRVKGADLRLFHGTLAEGAAEQPYGWVICDGRTITSANPGWSGRSSFTAPDLRGRFPCFHSGDEAPKSTGGSRDKISSSAGNHSHGGTTGGTALEARHLPIYHSDFAAQGPGGASIVKWRTADEHAHSIATSSAGAHQHAIGDVRPPYHYSCRAFLRWACCAMA